MSTTTTTRLAAAFLLSGITFAWAGAAYAVECKADADCPSGYECEKGMSMPGCAAGQDCSDAGPIVEETGLCVKAPVTCQVDSDCPQLTKCVAEASDTPCWADSSGDSGCAEPDPNPQKYCQYVPTLCTVDGDCPEGFACSIQEECASPPCPAGQECPPPPDCQPKSYCGPKEINCQADADCPAEWSCVEMYTACTVDSNPTGTAGAASQPEPCDTTGSRKLCSPPGFGGVGDYKESASASDSSGTANSQSTPASEDSGGGCQLAAGSASSGFAAWLVGAAALISIRRRRSR